MQDDEKVKQTVQDGVIQAYRLVQWFRTAPPDGAERLPETQGPTTVLTLAVAATALLVGALIFFGVIAVALKVFEYGFEPTLTYLSGSIFRFMLGVFFLPGALPVLAAATVAAGLALARRFQPRGLFLTGVFVIALGFASLWQLTKLIAALPTGEARVELEGPLLIIGLVLSAFLFVCGFQALGHCRWVREDEAGDYEGN